MTLQHLHFNLSLARIAAVGYHKSITAFNLVGAPLPIHRLPSGRRSEERETAPRPTESYKPHVHHARRINSTPAARAKRLASRIRYNALYKARRREMRRQAQLELELRALVAES